MEKILIVSDNTALQVQYHAGGAVVHRLALPLLVQDRVISRLKEMAGLSIADLSVPQEGLIPVRWDGVDYDLPALFSRDNGVERITLSIRIKTAA